MTIDRRRDPCNDLNHRIAAGLANDFTGEKIAEFASVSLSTINRYKNEQAVQTLAGIIRAANALNEAKTVEDLKSDFLERMKRLQPKAAKVYEHAMDSVEDGGDIKAALHAADSVTDRIHGKAKQPIEHEGGVQHQHVVVQIPPDAVHYWLEQQKQVAGAQNRALLVAGEDDPDAN